MTQEQRVSEADSNGAWLGKCPHVEEEQEGEWTERGYMTGAVIKQSSGSGKRFLQRVRSAAKSSAIDPLT
jgi:hypothetical protein